MALAVPSKGAHGAICGISPGEEDFRFISASSSLLPMPSSLVFPNSRPFMYSEYQVLSQGEGRKQESLGLGTFIQLGVRIQADNRLEILIVIRVLKETNAEKDLFREDGKGISEGEV